MLSTHGYPLQTSRNPKGLLAFSLDCPFIRHHGSIIMATKPSIKATINTLRESFAEEQKQAQAAFEKKIADLLVNVKKTVIQSLEEAQKAFEGLEKIRTGNHFE
jgi:hypothetical protein